MECFILESEIICKCFHSCICVHGIEIYVCICVKCVYLCMWFTHVYVCTHMYVCVYIWVWAYVEQEHAHTPHWGMHIEVREPPHTWSWPCLKKAAISLPAAYARVNDPQVPRNSLASVSHLPLGALELQLCAIIAGCMWFLGNWIHVLTLMYAAVIFTHWGFSLTLSHSWVGALLPLLERYFD